MTTMKVLKEIMENGLGAAYQEEIRERYHRNVVEGDYQVQEHDYDTAISELAGSFTPAQKKQLAEYEKTCSSLREYAAKYGFLAGIYSGFKHYFTLESEADGGFEKYVCNDIFKLPRMKRHQKYYADAERRNALVKMMEDGASDEIQYHIVSIACAWEQRSHSASIDGFYLGYHAAVAILQEVKPNSFPALKMEHNILCMEHRLGYIKNNMAQ